MIHICKSLFVTAYAVTNDKAFAYIFDIQRNEKYYEDKIISKKLFVIIYYINYISE